MAIYTKCEFFRSQVYEIIRLGSILATEGVPSPDRLSNSFLVYAFLGMKPGIDNPSLLPGEGLSNILDLQRFIASIQWFLMNLFGIEWVPMTFMYHALTILRLHLESPHLAQAW